jgi:hypothetical protein
LNGSLAQKDGLTEQLEKAIAQLQATMRNEDQQRGLPWLAIE